MDENLHALDLRHLWHPYSDIPGLEQSDFPIIERADGAYLYDSRGRAILDGISSWWGCNLGHSHPGIVEAIRRQTAALQHSILGGMSHPNAIRLAARLAAVAPRGLTRALFASDGSSAVEAALKIALQYWANIGKPEKNGFVSLADAYHGDTLGAMSVGYLPAFHRPFENVLWKAERAASPHCSHCPFQRQPESCDIECFGSMETILRRGGASIAAVIVEPLCQAAAGMRIYPAAYLRRLREICDRQNILLIADEIAVGFGRTGRLFACEHAAVSPDIMCLGKALTGGYLPMSATLVSDRIYSSFKGEPGRDRTFYHGHTYCGNPIAAAAAIAAIEAYAEKSFFQEIAGSLETLKSGFQRLARLAAVSHTRTFGMIGALDVAEGHGGAARARTAAARALEAGLFIRPLGPVLYLWPPLTASPDEISRMVSILEASLASR